MKASPKASGASANPFDAFDPFSGGGDAKLEKKDEGKDPFDF